MKIAYAIILYLCNFLTKIRLIELLSDIDVSLLQLTLILLVNSNDHYALT